MQQLKNLIAKKEALIQQLSAEVSVLQQALAVVLKENGEDKQLGQSAASSPSLTRPPARVDTLQANNPDKAVNPAWESVNKRW